MCVCYKSVCDGTMTAEQSIIVINVLRVTVERGAAGRFPQPGSRLLSRTLPAFSHLLFSVDKA